MTQTASQEDHQTMTEAKSSPVIELGSAILFLTRFPVSQRLFRFGYPPLTNALWAFALVGAGIGLVGAFVFWLATAVLMLPSILAATLSMASITIATGALHEDGLADMADGFGSGKTGGDAAKIMKDSLIGSYGASALIIIFFLRVVALHAAAIDVALIWVILPAALATGRFFTLIALTTCPHSPHASLGKLVSAPSLRAMAIGVLTCLWFYLYLPTALVITGLFLAGLSYLIIRMLAIKKIGGLTGDVMGAVIIITETAFLIAMTSQGGILNV